MGYGGIGGGDGVLKAKSSGFIGERVRVMSVDDVLDGALGVFDDRCCCFSDGVLASSCVRSMNNLLGGIIVIFGFLEVLERTPWKYLRLKMSEEDDNLKIVLWIFMAIFRRPTNYCFSRSYKVVKVRYIRSMIQPEPEGSTQDTPLDRVEVLGSDDGVTTSFQRSQDSRPHAQLTKIHSR
nr:hypothetical protein [Tanacetum cinerariifolium]